MKKYIIKSVIFTLILSFIMIGTALAKTGTIKDSDYLNLRESSTTSSNLLVKMPADAKFEILGEDGDWYKVKYQDYTGYVSKQYVNVESNIVNTNIPAKANSKGIINKNSEVYILPLLNSTKISTISSNDEVLVISITGKWAYIQNDTLSGWIFTSNVNAIEENTNSIENNKTDNQESANNSDNNQESNQDNMENTVPTDNSQTDNANYPKTMYVNVDALYVRSTASTESDTVASVGLNTPVTVNGEEGEWYKVHISDGSGYMMKKYLSNEKQPE